MTQSSPARAEQSYRHEALLWHDRADFTDSLVPFVTDGLDAGEPVMVAVVEEHVTWLRDALGTQADKVQFFDMAELGRNPAKIIPAWQKFLDTDAADGVPARGVGEPIWAGRGADELIECQVHEALLNVAVDPTIPFWLVCPYDVAGLEPAVIDEAYRGHPVVIEADAYRGSTSYAGRAHLEMMLGGELPTLVGEPTTIPFSSRNHVRLRAFLKLEGHVAGLGLQTGYRPGHGHLRARGRQPRAWRRRRDDPGLAAAAVGGLRGGRRHPSGRSARWPPATPGGRRGRALGGQPALRPGPVAHHSHRHDRTGSRLPLNSWRRSAAGAWLAAMRLLILGGTAWLGGEIARIARDRGYATTCLARGGSGPPVPGVELVRADRTEPGAYDAVRDRDWDAVLDVSRQPGQVRTAVEALGGQASRFLFVSSGNVYADHRVPGQDESSPLLPPLAGEVMESMAELRRGQGRLRAACARRFRTGGGACRPGRADRRAG